MILTGMAATGVTLVFLDEPCRDQTVHRPEGGAFVHLQVCRYPCQTGPSGAVGTLTPAEVDQHELVQGGEFLVARHGKHIERKLARWLTHVRASRMGWTAGRAGVGLWREASF